MTESIRAHLPEKSPIELHSPYTEIAIRNIQRAIKKRMNLPNFLKKNSREDFSRLPEIMSGVIHNIDYRMQENLGTHHSTEYDVDIPISHFSLNEIVEKAFHASVPSSGKREVRFIFISFGFQPYPTPQFGGDWVYNDAFSNLGKIINGKQIDFYIVGLPYGMGGSESQKMKKAREIEGFESYGKIAADIIQKKVPVEVVQKGDVKIRINGLSLSTQIVEKGYKHLPKIYQEISYVIKDNPVADFDSSKSKGISYKGRKLNSLKVPLGFQAEGIFGQFNPTIRAMNEGQKKYLTRLKERLNISDTQEQRELRSEAQWSDVLNMTQGSPLEHHNSRLKTRRGVWDPTSITFQRAGKEFLRLIKGRPVKYSEDLVYRQRVRDDQKDNQNRRKPKTYEYPVRATHSINRFHPEKWIDRTLYVLRKFGNIPQS